MNEKQSIFRNNTVWIEKNSHVLTVAQRTLTCRQLHVKVRWSPDFDSELNALCSELKNFNQNIDFTLVSLTFF